MSSREKTWPPMLYAVSDQKRSSSSTEEGRGSAVARPCTVRALYMSVVYTRWRVREDNSRHSVLRVKVHALLSCVLNSCIVSD